MKQPVSPPAADPEPAKGLPPLGIVVMGVSGCGKSTVGKSVAESLDAAFLDADDLHPAANKNKMSAGIPLTDGDRAPWLDRVGRELGAAARTDGLAITACSALRRLYRERLARAADLDPLFVLLDGSREHLLQRVENRSGHFMPPSLLDSQLATLERPGADEKALVIDIALPLAEMVTMILSAPDVKVRRRPIA